MVDSVDTGKSKFDKEGSSGEYPILGSTSVIGYDDEYDYEGDFILTARVGQMQVVYIGMRERLKSAIIRYLYRHHRI